MDNLKSPAYPQPITMGSEGDILTPVGQDSDFAGFTKLELASLMVLQGLVSNGGTEAANFHWGTVVDHSVRIAGMLLEEANK